MVASQGDRVMQMSLVLTVIGNDRPGIVESLAGHVAAVGANWEESRMARLAGKFTGLLRVSVDDGSAEDLERRLSSLTAEGLTIVVERSDAPAAPAPQTLRLQLVGNDRPGIVREVSRVLAGQRVNIEELQTEVTPAPMSGELLFRASARLSAPPTVTLDALRRQLEALAGELMVDLDVDAADDET
jgi:glycine cleavage system regulatory protein